MTYLIAAILLATSLFVVFRLFTRYNVDNFQAIVINYIVAFGLGLLVSDIPPTFNDIITIDWIPWAAIIGITFVLVFYLFALSSQKAGIAITAVSSKMSVIIPVIMGFLIFNEKASLIQIIGIILTLIAFVLILKKDKKDKINHKYLLLPILIFFGNGINDTMMKHTQFSYIRDDREFMFFLTVMFFVALIVGLIIISISYIKKRRKISLANIIWGSILGVINFYCTLFFLQGLNAIDVSVFMPIFNVSIVSLSAIIGFFIFKEKIKFINLIGLLIAVFAILLITEFVVL